MKTTINIYGKGNKVVFECVFDVWSCFVLSNNCCCMCCHGWCVLYHIQVSWIDYDNIRSGPKAVFDDKNIDSMSNVVGEKVGNPFCIFASRSKIIVTMVSWIMSWVVAHSFSHGHKSKWIPKSSIVCSHWQCEKCATISCDKLRWVCNIIRKWTEDKWNARVVGWVYN